MRTVFGAILLAAVSLGLYATISTSLAASRDTRPATFAERFAPVMPH